MAKLTEQEQQEVIRFVEAGKPLPEKYRFLLFDDKREVELVWNGKTNEVTNVVLPRLTPRVYREYKSLSELDVSAMGHQKVLYRQFSEDEQREIVFKDVTTGEVTHTTILDYFAVGFKLDYVKADGDISNYYPDFVVRRVGGEIWIVETKGREDLNDPGKWERLKQWCADATALDKEASYNSLFIREEDWERYKPKSFHDAVAAFDEGQYNPNVPKK